MAMNPLNYVVRAWSALRAKPADPDRGSNFSVITQNNAGVPVTHEKAFEVAAVWACIDAIASAMSASDWNVYEGVRGDDKTTALPKDSLNYILNTRFNPEMTAQAGKRALMIAAVGYGNGYAEIERDLAGRIIALWPIAPDRVEPKRELATGRLYFEVTNEYMGGSVQLNPEDVLHIRGAGLTGVVGDSVLARSVQTLAQAIAVDQFGSAYFGNNTQLGTVFMYKSGKIDDTSYERLKEQMEKRHRGASKAFKSAFLDGGDWDVKTMGTDADKAQLIEAKHAVIEDVCRYFHVPPHKVQHLLRATNNNIEHQGLEFTRDTLRPWVKEVQQEADYKLVPMRGMSKFVEIDLDWAEQGDYKSRADAFSIYRAAGVFSANDILRKLGENTIGPDGDIRIVQGANVRLEDVGMAYTDNADPTPGDSTPRATEPAEPEEPEDDEGENEVVEAWLTSVFAKIQSMHTHRYADKGEKAKADATTYAEAQLEPLGKHLGLRKYAAKKAVPYLFDGMDAAKLAGMVMHDENLAEAMLVEDLRDKLDL